MNHWCFIAVFSSAFFQSKPGLFRRKCLLFDAIATAELEKTLYAMKEASRLIIGEPLPLKIKTAGQRQLFTG